MNSRGFTLFETAIGQCGIAWGARGILGLQLPEGSDEKTRTRLRRRFPGAAETEASPPAARAIAGITELLAGRAADLTSVPLDMTDVPELQRRVYQIARTIPPGETLSYGEIAKRLGDPLQARAVGHALAKNPFPIVVPCHRVLAAGGRTGGFSAPGGIDTKLRLLAIEGARAAAIPTLFD